MSCHNRTEILPLLVMLGMLSACATSTEGKEALTTPDLVDLAGVEDKGNGCFVLGDGSPPEKQPSGQIICPVASPQTDD